MSNTFNAATNPPVYGDPMFPCLKVVGGDEKGKWYTLGPGENTMGRGSKNNIVIGAQGQLVSKNHAIVIFEPGGAFVEDKGSTNGTFVNNQKIDRQQLNEGDIIRLAKEGPELELTFDKPNYPPAQFVDSSGSIGQAPSTLTNTSMSTNKVANSDTPVGQSPLIDNLKPSQSPLIPPLGSPQKPPADEFPIIPPLGGTPNPVPGNGPRPSKSTTGGPTSFPSSPSGPPKLGGGQSLYGDDFDSSLSFNQSMLSVTPGQPQNKAPKTQLGRNGAPIDQRINEGLMGTMDGKILLTNKKASQQVLASGNISTAQKRTIQKFQKAYNRLKIVQYSTFGAIILVLIIVAGYYSVGYYKNKKLLQKGLNIEEELDKYEHKIEQASSGKGNPAEIRKLYAELERKQFELDSIRYFIKDKDQQRFFADTVEYFLDEIMKEFHEESYHIPPQMTRRVKHYLNKHQASPRKHIESILQRREQYFPHIQLTFREYRIPEVLAYVAIQESHLKTNARSHASAVGMWQFIRSTGLSYGLTINARVDERLDWEKATVAAAKYFKKLIIQFGKGGGVLLAMASYNAGENRVSRSLQQVDDPMRDRDFWYLYRTGGALANETREYVPQILAWAILDRHRDYYGYPKAR